MSYSGSVDQTALIKRFLFPFITMIVLVGVLFAAAGEAANPIETKRAQGQAILAELAGSTPRSGTRPNAGTAPTTNCNRSRIG